MKVLCSFVGGAGHLVPQLPLLTAMAEAGHDLTLVGRASATRSAPDALFSRVLAREDRRSGVSVDISPLNPVSLDEEFAVVSDLFAGAAARTTVDELRESIGGFDVVVCDELDFGAMAAAQLVGIRAVVIAVIASGALVRPSLVEAALRELGDAVGLDGAVHPFGDAFVVPFAASMRDPEHPAPDGALWMRPDVGPDPAPDGSLLITLGTEFNTESGDLFERMLAAVAELDRPTTVAIGRDLDPSRFGPQPARIDIVQYADLDALLARASVVLHHGGSGLLVRSVLAGTPQLVLPMGADQPLNAERIRTLGIGSTLDPLTASPRDIRRSVLDLIDNRIVRDAVLGLREELVALPLAETLVPQIERLVRSRRVP